MKKLFVFPLVFLLACSSGGVNVGLNEISGEEVSSKVTSNETFLLMIYTDDCYSCDVFEEEIKDEMKKNELVIYHLNYDGLNDNMKNQFELIFDHYSSWPALVYVQGGEVYDYAKYEYSLDPEGWKEWFQKQSLTQAN